MAVIEGMTCGVHRRLFSRRRDRAGSCLQGVCLRAALPRPPDMEGPGRSLTGRGHLYPNEPLRQCQAGGFITSREGVYSEPPQGFGSLFPGLGSRVPAGAPGRAGPEGSSEPSSILF